jgi:hypothetical protein
MKIRINHKNSLDDKEALLSLLISIMLGIMVTLLILHGYSVMPINSSMISCSPGMIPVRSSTLIYKLLLLIFVLFIPVMITLFTNMKILLFVRIIKY